MLHLNQPIILEARSYSRQLGAAISEQYLM
jgi:hypothetical protein